MSRRDAIQGLLWCEWFAHSKQLLFFLGAWLICVWVTPLFIHPGWILAFGLLYACVAGPSYGGSDVIEGCEEYTFALPPTRSERYFARLTVGGGTFLLFTALDLLALGLDLPQVLAKLYVDTGLIRPWPILRPGLLYGLVLAFPFAVFALSFAASAVTCSRRIVFTSWFWASVGALIVLQLGFWYEDLVWEKLNGYFSCPLLLGTGIAGIWAGHRAYVHKEVGQYPAPLVSPARWWLWLALFILGLAVALALAASLANHYTKVLGGS